MPRFFFFPLVFACAHLAFAAPAPIQGITEPALDVTLSPTVQGVIHRELFKEGDAVKQGDAILELDSTLEQLEADRRKEVMERTRTDFDSTKALFERSKAVSKDELDKKQMEYRVAVAEHGIAQEQFKRRKILAPFAGTIVEIFLRTGASCEAYQPVVRLVDTKRCYFVGHVEAEVAAGLKLDQKVQVQVPGVAEKIPATISFIAPLVDSASGLAKVKAVFENAGGRVRPGVAGNLFLN